MQPTSAGKIKKRVENMYHQTQQPIISQIKLPKWNDAYHHYTKKLFFYRALKSKNEITFVPRFDFTILFFLRVHNFLKVAL